MLHMGANTMGKIIPYWHDIGLSSFLSQHDRLTVSNSNIRTTGNSLLIDNIEKQDSSGRAHHPMI